MMIPMETGEQHYFPHVLYLASLREPRVDCANHTIDSHLMEGVYPEETMSPQDTEYAL